MYFPLKDVIYLNIYGEFFIKPYYVLLGIIAVFSTMQMRFDCHLTSRRNKRRFIWVDSVETDLGEKGL